MTNATCTYKPACPCARCDSMRAAVESADCDFGSCGDCPRCRAELEAEFAHYQSPEFQAEVARALADLPMECDGSSRCDCDRCDAEREMAADEELRVFSSEGRDEQEEFTYRWWLCEERGL